jgi:hypothetical protein
MSSVEESNEAETERGIGNQDYPIPQELPQEENAEGCGKLMTTKSSRDKRWCFSLLLFSTRPRRTSEGNTRTPQAHSSKEKEKNVQDADGKSRKRVESEQVDEIERKMRLQQLGTTIEATLKGKERS